MTSFTVEPARSGLRGLLRAPGDKSISHRALLLAAKAKGRSVITGLSDGADVQATLRAIQCFGAEIASGRADAVVVDGGNLHEPDSVIDVGNSGTAIRLIAGWATGISGLTVLQGDRSIASRPMGRVTEPLRLMGARIDGRRDGDLPPLTVRGGGLAGIDYTLPVPSAQVKGAVLLAGLSAEGPTTVREPLPTRAHTEQMLAERGVPVEALPGFVMIHPAPLQPLDTTVAGDPSQAAFWIVAACVTPGSDLVVEGVYLGPGRAGFLDVLRRMGANVSLEHFDARTTVGDVRARHGALTATSVRGTEVPGLIDEIPVLSVAAAFAEGTTTFADAAELKVKESDRIASTVAALRQLGVEAEGHDDGLAVTGGAGAPTKGGTIDSAGDHRVAMSAAVAALAGSAPVRIDGWDAVDTSYPSFEEDMRKCLTASGS